jgi:DNA mismatch endonuclease, patch repair protein
MDWLTPEQRKRNMVAIRAKDTKPEMLVRKLVFSPGYRYRLHARDLPGHPDMVFPSLRKIIDVRGCFWHRHTCKDGVRTPETNAGYWAPKIERNVARDRENEEAWRRLGWDVLVLWECQVKEREALRQVILGFLPKRLEGT